jgi:hypothetical protein
MNIIFLFNQPDVLTKLLKERHPGVYKYIKEHKLDKLGKAIYKNGFDIYKTEIYTKLSGVERALLFFYMINTSVVHWNFKLAGEVHKYFVQEMVENNLVTELEKFVKVAFYPDLGAFSYAAENVLEGLQEQLETCKDEETKKILEELYNKLKPVYLENKTALEENWELLQTAEEVRKFIINLGINLLNGILLAILIILVVKTLF